MTEVRDFWDDFYTEKVWSGRVNARLVEVASELPAGRALDVGCGEGADAIWLAEHGWQVVGVDVSATALQRAGEVAQQRNVAPHIRLERHELPDSFPDGEYDLVQAQFLHSPVHLDREAVLRRAADAVTAGGRLLIVDHATAPPWAGEHAHAHHFDTVDKVLDGLALDDAQWERLRVGTVERDAVGPDGQQATLTDNVILLRRRAAQAAS